MKELINRLSNTSIWTKIAFVFFLVIGAYSAYSAYEERNPALAFAEIFLATIFANGNQIVSVFIGYLTGKKISDASSKKWLGWVIGIAVFLLSTTTISLVASEIPGVGWRYKAICSESPYC